MHRPTSMSILPTEIGLHKFSLDEIEKYFENISFLLFRIKYLLCFRS